MPPPPQQPLPPKDDPNTLALDPDRHARTLIPSGTPPKQDPQKCTHNFDEVFLGYDEAQAIVEATRCIYCPAPEPCILGCPVHNDIRRAQTTPNLQTTRWGTFVVESEENGATTRAGVYAAGDDVRGADLVVTAVAAARKAAFALDEWLKTQAIGGGQSAITKTQGRPHKGLPRLSRP